jgi:Uma2 family endonuclease
VQKHIREVFASSSPEICVEIISPSNTQEEMVGKVKLFIEARAKEVWLITEKGEVTYYGATGRIPCSSYEINLDKLI